ncbi:glycogen debranching protein GlgX [Spirosoma utsteinense]|uniref:Glycogen operon protein n=1 Tax=Spirosoma utsteinense TaxID=2585773 RepID=A0ABR6W4C5_9BACT|nr:glycogen debranching protein GlgX [Spirosoma utsteinense]MBC3786398.1 glycogen operon protein [Spirosoma utsteinense]MBC3791446.1 glycogen operon protein [Spirosoma utsteinense]
MSKQQKTAPAPEPIQTKPGKPYPLGATYDGEGVNFALFSENATAVYLCLYDPADPSSETTRIPLIEQTDLVWHIYVDGLQPGQLYGFRIDGPYDPKLGSFFNANKLLLDPYARAINAPINHNDAWLGYDYKNKSEDRYLIKSEEDSGPSMPKSVVIDTDFDWDGDAAPSIPMHRSVIYEMHVKGFTHTHPTIDKSIRGTYAGLGTTESIDYLTKLGITAVELLPIHQYTDESYWGYNSIGFFAPQNTYSSSGMAGQQVTEFKEMVKSLHKAGIEVILDVVYNHTAEGNHFGPMLSFQGIDNRAYYHQVGDSPEHYMDYTGTGNTFNMSHPRALQLVMDSLRYWVTDMHVDGFRFDLASALVRTDEEVGRVSSFLDTVAQDPILAQVKLIAEPWDIQSYQVGDFPVRWSEWNGKYRDTLRGFWKGDEGKARETTLRLLGSPDLYSDGRSPANSVNLITAHDGFTLNDLVSYNDKHNEANGEDNRDGSNDNMSWNCGVEGPTDEVAINDLRERQKRNFLATMLLSQGTPMLVMGDECGRTQHGNNNGYNQDSEISWMNWNWDEKQQALFDFTSQLTSLRREIPLLSRRKFFGNEQVAYMRPDGQEMTEDDFNNPHTHCLALFIDGLRVDEQTEDGQAIGDEQLLWILNAYWDDVPFMLPKIGRKTSSWEVVVDTSTGQLTPDWKDVKGGHEYVVPGRSSVLLRLR